MARLKRGWTQKMVAERLRVPLYSYQRLEDYKKANPEWKTVVKLHRLFPELDLNEAA
jgi:DNA-binding XRE family transcriptional regulator